LVGPELRAGSDERPQRLIGFVVQVGHEMQPVTSVRQDRRRYATAAANSAKRSPERR
jgi:hypothetical protein